MDGPHTNSSKRMPKDASRSMSRVLSCDHCRLNHRSCTREEPCSVCAAKGIDCTYTRQSKNNVRRRVTSPARPADKAFPIINAPDQPPDPWFMHSKEAGQNQTHTIPQEQALIDAAVEDFLKSMENGQQIGPICPSDSRPTCYPTPAVMGGRSGSLSSDLHFALPPSTDGVPIDSLHLQSGPPEYDVWTGLTGGPPVEVATTQNHNSTLHLTDASKVNGTPAKRLPTSRATTEELNIHSPTANFPPPGSPISPPLVQSLALLLWRHLQTNLKPLANTLPSPSKESSSVKHLMSMTQYSGSPKPLADDDMFGARTSAESLPLPPLPPRPTTMTETVDFERPPFSDEPVNNQYLQGYEQTPLPITYARRQMSQNNTQIKDDLSGESRFAARARQSSLPPRPTTLTVELGYCLSCAKRMTYSDVLPVS
ncbi:hypothetical protein DFS34DRAFT_620515 [Phlyctochytrium arcticum]|nr:hypothetical protein DFS34DRAFT_620515 [Phlyctochytrium arcticum]